MVSENMVNTNIAFVNEILNDEGIAIPDIVIPELETDMISTNTIMKQDIDKDEEVNQDKRKFLKMATLLGGAGLAALILPTSVKSLIFGSNPNIGTMIIKDQDSDTKANVGVNGLEVDVKASALPTGAATSANQTTMITDLDKLKFEGDNLKVTIPDPPASTVSIVDTGNYYTGIEVETALAEIGAGTTLDARYVNVSGDTMTGQLNFSGTTHAGVKLLSLTTTQRDALTPANGMIIYNSTLDQVQGYVSGAWGQLGGAAALSALTAAIATNSIDSLNYAQTWAWSTLTTQTPLTITGNAITTGSLLSLTSSYAAGNSTNGLLYVANTSAVTNGIVGRIQSNSTAGSGLTVLASGNVGIGTTSPSQLLEINSGAGETSLIQFKANNGVNGLRVGFLSGYGGVYGTTTGNTMYMSGSNLRFTSTSLDTEWMRITTTGNVGIGTTSPTNLLSLGGNSARIFWMERHTTANTAGNNLLVQAGGATAAATDKNGGIATIAPGLSTGIGFGSARFQRLTRASSTATADNSLIDAEIIPSAANLTNNSAVGLFTVSLPTLAMAGGSIDYTITVTDGTDMQTYSGVANYAAVNKGATYTTQITDLSTTDATASSSIATLVVTWTITTGTNIIQINVNANSSLTPTIMKIYYKIHNGSANVVTQL